MKQLFLLALTTLSLQAIAQDKHNYTYFNKLTEVEGTEYVIARVENYGKMEGLKNRYLLFINSATGDTNRVSFPNQGYFQQLEQVKIDNLGINCLIVSAQTVDLDQKTALIGTTLYKLLFYQLTGSKKYN